MSISRHRTVSSVLAVTAVVSCIIAQFRLRHTFLGSQDGRSLALRGNNATGSDPESESASESSLNRTSFLILKESSDLNATAVPDIDRRSGENHQLPNDGYLNATAAVLDDDDSRAAGGTNATDGGGRGVRVFIAVKTSALDLIHQERIPQLRKTWLRDALAEPDVEVKFFVGGKGKVPSPLPAMANSSSSNSTASPVAGVLHEVEDSVFSKLVVSLPTCNDKKKLCKTFGMLRYFLEERLQLDSSAVATAEFASTVGPRPSFFCNFDDDTYVLVPNLLRALSDYQRRPPWYGKNLYIGRQTRPNGHKTKLQEDTVHFHTGGAWCLSSDMVRRGGQHFESLSHIRTVDDIAVGYMVQEKLNVTLVDDSRFHSHWENQKKEVPRDKIAEQVSFAYTNKHGNFDGWFADVPRMFSEEDDPLLFRSLRCFLLDERRKKDPKSHEDYASECNTTIAA